MADIETHRAEAAQALESGDTGAANQAYALELQARDGELQESEESHESESGESVEQTFDYLTEEFGDDAEQLRADWGSEANENLALGRALVEDHPELSTIAEEYGLQDHPGVLALAAAIAKKSGYSFDGRSQQDNPMSGMSREAFKDGMSRFEDRIQKAHDAGDSRLRDAIYAEKLEWIGRVKGNADIVGRNTRTV